MRSLLMCAAVIMVAGLASVVTALAATDVTGDVKSLPDWSTLEQVASRNLATLLDYQPGDVLVESNVMPIFDHFQQMGWKVTERRAIQRQLIKDVGLHCQKIAHQRWQEVYAEHCEISGRL